ncbi:MAG: outer membrane beta-barrel protein [Ginsengibacter sp.]
MKKIFFTLLFVMPLLLHAQFGIKGGLNFANVTSASSINNSSQTGFHAGILFSPHTKIIGFRTEFSYSKQGYNYSSDTNTGNVNLQYIMSANLMTISITHYFQIQFGFQTAFLINAKADSSKVNSTGTSGNPYGALLDYYNRYDYGFAGGVEVHPVSGLLIAARINLSLSKLYKSTQTGQSPSFSDVNVKNNVFQLSTGWIFGKSKSKSKSGHT